eukprot:10781134-Alexandrium_andersonii.AAC.1
MGVRGQQPPCKRKSPAAWDWWMWWCTSVRDSRAQHPASVQATSGRHVSKPSSHVAVGVLAVQA